MNLTSLLATTAGVGPDPDRGFWLLGQHSTLAGRNDAVWDYVMWVSVISCVAVIGLMLYFVIKYRRKSESDPIGQGATHNTPLEITWTVLPLFIVLVMFFWGLDVYVQGRKAPSDSYVVNATAQQWSWDFAYPTGTSSPDLHAWAGSPILISMRSTDVLHSLFIPAFRVKQDVVPGKTTTLWFEAIWNDKNAVDERLGFSSDAPIGRVNLYDLHCTEYCGTNHWNMNGRVVIHETREQFEEWQRLSGIKPEDMLSKDWGALLYAKKGCASCHSLDGSSGTGPSWANTKWLYENQGKRQLSNGEEILVDRNYLYTAITQPQAHIVAGPYGNMPYRPFNEEDLEGLIDFLTIGEGASSPTETLKVESVKPEGY